MFDLSDAIRRWRERLAQSDAIRPPDIEELEAHLRDEVDRLPSTQLSEEEVFLVATHRLGDAEGLAREFAKVNPGAVWRYRLFWMAAGALGWTLLLQAGYAAGQLALVTAAHFGLGSSLLAAVDIGARVIVFGAALFLVGVLAHRGLDPGRLGAVGRRTPWQWLAAIGVLPAIAGLYAAQICARYYTAQLVSVQELGRLALFSTYAGMALSLLLPVALVVMILRLRPYRSVRAEM